MADERNTEAAFKWVVNLLQTHNIPFQISGGFAARAYGSTRELADIDVGIPDDAFEKLYPEVKDYLTFGPAQYKDDEWDLELMTLKYQGQEIDIAGQTNIKIFDKDSNTWMSASRDLLVSEHKEIYGIIVPLIPKADLISYKKKLGREIDWLDIKALEE